MMFRTCSYEKDLAQALKDGHWPQGCGPELRAHVDACGQCSDLVLVTQTFRNARSESEVAASLVAHPAALSAAQLASPSLLWWRAQLRRRNAAAARVSRPITIAQGFAWCVVLFVGMAFVASQYRHGLRWASWWTDFSPSRAFHFLSIGTGQLNWGLILLMSGFGVLALLSALVVLLASEKS